LGSAALYLPHPGAIAGASASNGKPKLAKHVNPLVHKAYLATILIKGLFGLLEFCGGLIIATFGPERLYGVVLRVIDPELYECGHIRTAELVLRGASALAQSPGHFVIFYLFVHGTLKMTITAVLLRGHGRWVFPRASVILSGFIAFFCLDLAHHWSNWVLGLALFDALTLAPVVNEWRNWSKD
jgi:uncharacterized membrane protein